MRPLAKFFRERADQTKLSPAELRKRLHRDRRRTGWALLQAVAESRYITVEQAAVRLYPTRTGVHSAAARLNQLWVLGLLESFRPEREAAAGPRGGGSAPVVYCLSELGAEIVGSQLQAEPDWRPIEEEESISAAYVPHRLAIGDLHAALLAYSRASGGQVEHWTYEPAIMVGEAKKTTSVRPDAALLYRRGDRRWPLVVEIDRNTETPARFAREKCPRYNMLWESDDWRLHWPDDRADAAGGRPRVLVVVARGGYDRLVALKTEVEDLLRETRTTYQLYRFALADDLYRFSGDGHPYLGFDQPVRPTPSLLTPMATPSRTAWRSALAPTQGSVTQAAP